MTSIFADTLYWVALINPKDQWRERALSVSRKLVETPIVTTDEVLAEVLNFFAESGEYLRREAVGNVREILLNESVEIISCSHERFLEAIDFYESRPDKGYSLTDCISMIVIREHGISEVLTHDNHFTQEGFRVLL